MTATSTRIRLYIRFIRTYDEEIKSILKSIHELANANEDTDFVKQSGKFEGTKIQMSKRGSAIARRVVHTLALQSISISRTGDAKNPVLRDYYLKNVNQSQSLWQWALFHIRYAT